MGFIYSDVDHSDEVFYKVIFTLSIWQLSF